MEPVPLRFYDNHTLLPVLRSRVVHPSIMRGVERQMATFHPQLDSTIVALIISRESVRVPGTTRPTPLLHFSSGAGSGTAADDASVSNDETPISKRDEVIFDESWVEG